MLSGLQLRYAPEGNIILENIKTLGKTKLTSFPRDHTLSALLYIILDFPFNNHSKTNKKQTTERETTAELYPGWDTLFCILSGAHDQESTNHSVRLVE